jgi:CubicO group peptidase (beta-lactamase class C family)
MYSQRDWAGFILDLPMANPPGAVASYCTGGVVVLGEVIAERTGMGLDAYANAHLFAPLGVRESFWRPAPDGHATAGTGMRLRPRDLAKLGALYLEGGTWNGVRVLPTAWVEQSQERVTQLGSYHYGFLWWKRTFAHKGAPVECYYASGNGGNYVFVLPTLDLVVAFTGSNYNSPLSDQPYLILNDRLLPTIQ